MHLAFPSCKRVRLRIRTHPPSCCPLLSCLLMMPPVCISKSMTVRQRTLLSLSCFIGSPVACNPSLLSVPAIAPLKRVVPMLPLSSCTLSLYIYISLSLSLSLCVSVSVITLYLSLSLSLVGSLPLSSGCYYLTHQCRSVDRGGTVLVLHAFPPTNI